MQAKFFFPNFVKTDAEGTYIIAPYDSVPLTHSSICTHYSILCLLSLSLCPFPDLICSSCYQNGKFIDGDKQSLQVRANQNNGLLRAHLVLIPASYYPKMHRFNSVQKHLVMHRLVTAPLQYLQLCSTRRSMHRVILA
jgi:hypothetical protein